MPTYLERYLAGEREAVWAELASLGTAIRDQPLFADAQAVARETMRRARANVELLAQRLTTLGYRFVGDALGPRPTPYVPPNGESLAALRDLERQHGVLPLSIETWYEVVGAVDFMGVYPRLSTYAEVDLGDMLMWFQGQRLRVSLTPAPHILGPAPEPDPDPDAGIASDPLVVWPCIDALVDELEGEPPDDPEASPRTQYFLGFAPDAIAKAGESGGDGPHVQFGDARMDAPLYGDDWEGVPFVSYLRTAFAWGGFPGLRDAASPPREVLAFLCDGLLPL